jgi:hypothetical protein
MPGFAGAYFSGSINWLPDDAPLPSGSDVDVWIARTGDAARFATGKRMHEGLILDVASTSLESLQSAEAVLADYHVAPAFSRPNVIADPTGALTSLQRTVSAAFAEERWVRARCAHASRHALRYVRSWNDTLPLHDQVLAWAFAAGVTTHVLLSAGLRNPTVRRRYVDTRALLEEHGRADFYAGLLDLLGCGDIEPTAASRHLDGVAEAFDAAASVLRTPAPFASDLTPSARRIAIDGSAGLIARGGHREAMFWIVVTAARCQKVLQADAEPSLRDRHQPAFLALLQDLGVATPAAMRRRLASIDATLPRVEEVADAIIGGRSSPA